MENMGPCICVSCMGKLAPLAPSYADLERVNFDGWEDWVIAIQLLEADGEIWEALSLSQDLADCYDDAADMEDAPPPLEIDEL